MFLKSQSRSATYLADFMSIILQKKKKFSKSHQMWFDGGSLGSLSKGYLGSLFIEQNISCHYEIELKSLCDFLLLFSSYTSKRYIIDSIDYLQIRYRSIFIICRRFSSFILCSLLLRPLWSSCSDKPN